MYPSDELTAEECGHLARILLASRRVRQRHQFFAWVHGPVQSLVPHEILLCGLRDEDDYLLHERFSACRYFREEHHARALAPGTGLVAELADHWAATGEARLIGADAAPDWQARLADLELKNLMFQGLGGLNGRLKGYACLSRVRAPLDPRLVLYLDLLLPHLLATLARVLALEVREQGANGRPSAVITPREIEVLTWVREGKTNQEIALILGLSMLTAKNHLRHAMKKLDVRTRGQAVAKAIALGLLSARGARES